MKILAVGAHVDDVELFAGGTISRFGKDVYVLALSHHNGKRWQSPENEFKRSMEILGVVLHHGYHFPAVDGSIQRDRERVSEILRGIQIDWKPDVVITHQSTDTNQDHRSIYEEVIRVFKRRCSILGGRFTPNDFPESDRRLFVEIKVSDLQNKIDALMCYKSQMINDRPYFNKEVIQAEAIVCGHRSGYALAEAFEVIQMRM